MRYPMASHPEVVALYRWHGQNMSGNHSTMLKWVLRINDRQRIHTAGNHALEADRLLGRRVWCRYYAHELAGEVRHSWRSEHRLRPIIRLATRSLSMVPNVALELGRWAARSAWASVCRNDSGQKSDKRAPP